MLLLTLLSFFSSISTFPLGTPMDNRVLLLGTGTCQIEPDRMASSVLIELGKTRVLYDMGRGIPERLVQAGFRSNDITNLVLSHFHPDHVEGLIPFLHAACWSRGDPRSTDLTIYGPKGVEVQVMRLLSLFGPDELTRPHFKVKIVEERGDTISVGDVTFEYPELPPASNHGLGFTINGKRVVLTGDSYFHEQEIAFLRGAEIAVIDSGHLKPEEIVELAVSCRTPRIICSHLYHELSATELTDAARGRGYPGTIIVGHDLMTVPL